MQSINIHSAARAFASPLSTTLIVWKALFLREAGHRLLGRRTAWAWVLAEPLCHIAYLTYVFSVIRMRKVGGIHVAIWLLVGLLAFFMFRRTATQTMNAVSANQALFGYRQVKPVDTVLVRAGLECFLATVITIAVFLGSGLFGLPVFPDNPLAVMQAFFGLWLMGLGYGLIASVATKLYPGMSNFLRILMIPLYMLSGVLLSLSRLPSLYRQWLMLNPVAHGLEAARHGYASYYYAAPETSIAYLYGCAGTAVFFGLALHRHFAGRMVER